MKTVKRSPSGARLGPFADPRIARGQAAPVSIAGNGSTVTFDAVEDFRRELSLEVRDGNLVLPRASTIYLWIEGRWQSQAGGYREFGVTIIEPTPAGLQRFDTRPGIGGVPGGEQVSGFAVWGTTDDGENVVRLAARQNSGVPLTFSSVTVGALVIRR